MTPRRRRLGVLLLLVTAFVGAQSLIARRAIHLHLRLYGEAVFEARSRLGRWPASLDDLEGTNLSRQMPHWRRFVEDGAYTLVWHPDLHLDPRRNRDRILARDAGSLFVSLGLTWACWGDLRIGRAPGRLARAPGPSLGDG